ncbi:MAG TPA: OmpA family protein [Alphaproteobacteria bacterium]|nr:OmpA family protein [Alphaproteobacteria bacterium]
MQKVRPRMACKLGKTGIAALLFWAATGCTAIDSGLGDVPGADQPFPNLASVPERPIGYSTAAERGALQDRLALDRAAAAPLGSASAGTSAAPQPDGGEETVELPLTGIDERDIAGGGWLNEKLPQKPARALAGLVFFDNGSAELKPKGRDVLRALAALQRDKGGVLRLVGHASSVSTASDPAERAEINDRVARRRVEAAAAELRRLGLAADQIQLAATGAEAPAYDEATPLGEAGNRRVEIYLEL